MAGAAFSRESLVSADPAHCWEVLTDVDVLVSWVSIVHDVKEISRLDKYEALLMDKVGPIKLKAPLSVDVEVLDEGTRVRIAAEGTDPQVNSHISVEATLELAARDGGGTTVTVGGEYAVMGKVASMGGGIIKKKADKIIAEFFSAMEKEFGVA